MTRETISLVEFERYDEGVKATIKRIQAEGDNPLADVQWFGKSIFDVMDYSVSNVMMPLGGIGVTLFAGWRVWPVIASQSALPPLALSGLKWSCRVLAPTAIAIILLKNL